MSESKKKLDVEEWISLLVEREIKQGVEIVSHPKGGFSLRRCRLCNTDKAMNPYSFDYHCQQANHQERVREVNTYMNVRQTVIARWNQARELNYRIEQLGLPQWREEVEKILYRYINIGSEDDIEITEDCYEKACAALCQHEKREHLSLLELAVWKTACLLEPLEMPRDYLTFFHFLTEGWKANKTKVRGANSIAIIVQQVSPFLD